MNIGAFIKDKRLELDMTLAQVAEAAGVTSATVQRWECGAIRSINLKNLRKLAAALNVSIDALQSINGTRSASTTNVPAINSATSLMGDEESSFITNLTEIDMKKHYILTMPDNAMAPTILAGDTLLVSKDVQKIENGKIMAVKSQKSILVRHVFIRNNEMTLVSKCEQYPPVYLPFHQPQDEELGENAASGVEILGRVVMLQRKMM